MEEKYYLFGVSGELVCVMALSRTSAIRQARELFEHCHFYREIPEEEAFWLECDIY